MQLLLACGERREVMLYLIWFIRVMVIVRVRVRVWGKDRGRGYGDSLGALSAIHSCSYYTI